MQRTLSLWLLRWSMKVINDSKFWKFALPKVALSRVFDLAPLAFVGAVWLYVRLVISELTRQWFQACKLLCVVKHYDKKGPVNRIGRQGQGKAGLPILILSLLSFFLIPVFLHHFVFEGYRHLRSFCQP